MNNCNLDKLIVKPGKIFPKYSHDILKYDIILGVSNNKTTLDFYTEDSGASYQILVEGGDGSKTIEIAEGACKILKIEVTAEDGKTTRTYLLNIKRHSGKAAVIESLKANRGKLIPEFSSDVFEYRSVVGLRTNDIAFDIQLPDPKCKSDINKVDLQKNYTLNMGRSIFRINVTSPDGTNTKTYTISIIKKYNPYYIFIPNLSHRWLYEDSITLSPCFNAIKTNEVYSWDFVSIEEARQLTNLGQNNHSYPINIDEDIDNILSGLDGQLLKENFVLSPIMKICELGSIMEPNTSSQPLSSLPFSFSPFNDSINLVPDWQKNFTLPDLNQSENELLKTIEESIKAYISSRPKCPVFQENQIISHESPSKKLSSAISYVSVVIVQQKSKSQYHFKLAQLLEENYLLADVLNVTLFKADSIETDGGTGKLAAGADTKAVISSKQDEILAICRLHGFTGNPTDAEQLKSLDLEYHSLISQNQSSRADAIQNLFEWKSKQATLEGTVSSEVNKEGTLIGQAFNKYLAALSLDKKSYLYNFHVGRLLIMQGKYKEASERLLTALSCNGNHIPSKFCLGLTLANLPDSEKSPNSIFLIVEAFGKGFNKFSEDFFVDDIMSDAENKLLMDDEHFFQLRNPLISKGLLQLAKMLIKTPQPRIEAKPLFIIHWALHLAVGGWCNVARGNTLIYFESTIIECQRQLLTLMVKDTEQVPDNVLTNRCLWLLNFIRASSIPINQDLINMQEELAKVPLYFNPSNVHLMALFGEALSKKADHMIVKDAAFKSTIETAIKVLYLALDVKTKKNVNEAESFIKTQSWFKGKELIIFKSNPTIIASGVADKKIDGPQKSAPTATKALPTKTPTTPVALAAKKGAPVAKKGPIKPAGKDTGSNKDKIVKQAEDEKKPASVTNSENSEKKTNQFSRTLASGNAVDSLGIELLLARAYCINRQYAEGAKFYKMSGVEKNITKLNDLIQEYIEVLIAADDHSSALGIYLKLPINEKNPSFDDGYICGEIVYLMMKAEKYVDKNLIKYAALWAKIFGFGILEKEIKILEDKGHSGTCMEIYASLHGKKVDDPELQMFFRSKCWI